MGLFDKLFGGAVEPKKDEPSVRFGRFSDTYKVKAQYDCWDKSFKLFDEKNYLESYKEFFRYLRDEKEDNVQFKVEGDTIKYELYQGSKTHKREANAKHVTAEANVVKCDKLSVSFMRRLMEMNYNLKYARFCLPNEETISLKFETSTLDGSPEKVYFAIKEVANTADKQDDLLEDEFSMLHAIDNYHTKELSVNEKRS